MLKVRTIGLGVMAACLVGAATVSATEGQTTSGGTVHAPAGAMPGERHGPAVTGKITALEPASQPSRLSLASTNGTVWTFNLVKDTTVWVEGKALPLEQGLASLKVGQSIRVRHELKESQQLALAIELVPATPLASTPKPAPPKVN